MNVCVSSQVFSEVRGSGRNKRKSSKLQNIKIWLGSVLWKLQSKGANMQNMSQQNANQC